MASTTPWTVRTTKRKVATTTPGPRKRRRASLPANDRAESRARRGKQQTLTQIVPHLSRPVVFDDGELEEIKTESKRKARVPRLKKRDSTLTQLGFIGDKTMGVEITEDDMKPLAVSAPNLAILPQLDGTYDSPRKPRPSKSGSHRKRKSVSLRADESQEYMPTTKRKKGKAETDDTPKQTGRRRSTRQSSKVPSDPAVNFALFQEKLAEAIPNPKTPLLKITDSTGFEDAENTVQPQQDELPPRNEGRSVFEIHDSIESVNKDVEVLVVSPLKPIHKTPQKERHYIPSSQSPDSLPPSTRKNLQNTPSKHNATTKHNPLVEQSTNTPSRRPVFDAGNDHKSNLSLKQKLSTLKKPGIHLGLKKKRVEDSQADVWSVQPTSSLRKGDSQKTPKAAIQDEAIAEEALAEIPSTSQGQSTASVTSSPPRTTNGDTQESLLSLHALLGFEKKDTTVDKNDEQPEPSLRQSKVEVKHVVEQPQETQHKEIQYVSLLDTQILPNTVALHTDDGSDFGSPIANDTQFGADLQARIPTSPLLTSDRLRDLNPRDTIRISSSSSSKDDPPISPLSAPKLADQVKYQNSTTTVPTKDLSSPVLPPMPPPSQRPIAPASLPHPSQISTQEPSQQLPQLSSLPQRSPAQTDRITIKDSSSMHEPLSQLPEYNDDELQLQRELEKSQHVMPDDEEEDDYDDLDPRTPRKVVRFQEPREEPKLEPFEQNAVPEPSPPSQQAHFTQNGHVTAARIEDMRKRGLIPPGYQPPAYQVPSPRELLPAWMFEDDDE